VELEASQARGDRSILARTRQWWAPSKVDPNKPHAYEPIDAGAAPAIAGSSRGGGAESLAPAMILVKDAMSGRCRVYGCNRQADDPIHL
jgi:hypothetical protein